MVEERDLEVFLKAKRDKRRIDILIGLSFLSLATLIGLEAFGVAHNYTTILATFSAVFMGASASKNRRVSVPRDDLLTTLERVINSDSEALKMLANKKINREQARDFT